MAPPSASRPVKANFPSEHLTIAAGVAIFHLASSRVVLCYHTRDDYWFLPKGRRNAGESSARNAEREGFEESGYRNRVLKIPMRHRQTEAEEFVAEPVWTQFMQLSERTQYLLYWYIAETMPRAVEEGNMATMPTPRDQTIRERIAEDVNEKGEVYEPKRHEGTGVDEEELLYDAKLLPIDEACRKLRGTIMEDVIKRGWEGIQARMRAEDARALGADASAARFSSCLHS